MSKRGESSGGQGGSRLSRRKKCKPGEPVEERVPREDAVLSHETYEAGGQKYMSVVLAKGWEKVVDRVGEDDPFIMVDWNVDNLNATVVTLQGHAAAPLPNPPPAWLAAPYTADTVRTQILQFIVASASNYCAPNNVGNVVGRCMIGPNTVEGFTLLRVMAALLPTDGFFANHATLPLGDCYRVDDKKNKNIGVLVSVGPAGVGAAPPANVFS